MPSHASDTSDESEVELAPESPSASSSDSEVEEVEEDEEEPLKHEVKYIKRRSEFQSFYLPQPACVSRQLERAICVRGEDGKLGC